MRKIFLYLIAVLISVSGLSQHTFKKIFTSPGYDSGIAAFRTSDRGYLIVGNTSGYGHGGSDIWVIALDSNADFLWQKTYGSSGNEEATKAIITPSDELIITGNSTSSVPSTINVFVLRLSKTGVPFFMQTYGGSDWDFSNSITMQNDSTILICGSTYNGPNFGLLDPFVMAVSNQGNWLWTTYEGSGGEEDNRDIVVGDDKKIYVAGSSMLSGSSVDTAYIKCLDSLGNLLWQSNLTGYSRSQLMSLVMTIDSNITATGFHMDSTESYREPFFAKFKRDGSLVWIRNGAQATDAYFSYIEEEPSGKLVIAGMTTAFALGGEDMYCATFSSDGWFFDGSIIGGFEDDFSTMNSFDKLDATYLAVGTTKSYHTPMSGIFLVQMNDTMYFDSTLQMIVISSVKGLEKKPLIVKLYPNPASDIINLKFNSGINETADIRILDMNGKMIMHYRISELSGVRKLDISRLARGIYILSMESKSYKFNTKINKL